MPLILGANSVTGGYEIDNSLRFNHGSSDELARTMGTATDGKKCTISFWIKKCRIEGSTTTVRFMQAYSGVGNQFHSQWGMVVHLQAINGILVQVNKVVMQEYV
jgi:hypothetical protein